MGYTDKAVELLKEHSAMEIIRTQIDEIIKAMVKAGKCLSAGDTAEAADHLIRVGQLSSALSYTEDAVDDYLTESTDRYDLFQATLTMLSEPQLIVMVASLERMRDTSAERLAVSTQQLNEFASVFDKCETEDDRVANIRVYLEVLASA